jgi:putative transposase
MHKTKIKIHLIFVTKYRKKILKDDIASIVKSCIIDTCKQSGIQVVAIQIDNQDHIHMMLELNPRHSVSKVVQLLKEKSRYTVWKSHPVFLRKSYWYKNLFWSRGYFCSSTGDAGADTIEKYIRGQG